MNNSIKTKNITNARKLLKIIKISKNNITNNKNNKTRKNIANQKHGKKFKVIIVYSLVPDKKDTNQLITFLNWCAIIQGKKFVDIRQYKLLPTKKGIKYNIFFNILYLSKDEYIKFNKDNFNDRTKFEPSMILGNPIFSKEFTITQSKSNLAKNITLGILQLATIPLQSPAGMPH